MAAVRTAGHRPQLIGQQTRLPEATKLFFYKRFITICNRYRLYYAYDQLQLTTKI